MHPVEFQRKWREASVKERSGAQEHFIDICRLVGAPTPVEADPSGEFYAFEKGAEKLGGGDSAVAIDWVASPDDQSCLAPTICVAFSLPGPSSLLKTRTSSL